MKINKEFNVILWDINRDELESYDVLPYFRKEYKDCPKKDRPKTKQQWRQFVERKGKYRFHAQCQYEFLISSWPPMEPPKDKHIKIDAWMQIENNLDIVVDLLMSEFNQDYE